MIFYLFCSHFLNFKVKLFCFVIIISTQLKFNNANISCSGMLSNTKIVVFFNTEILVCTTIKKNK